MNLARKRYNLFLLFVVFVTVTVNVATANNEKLHSVARRPNFASYSSWLENLQSQIDAASQKVDDVTKIISYKQNRQLTQFHEEMAELFRHKEELSRLEAQKLVVLDLKRKSEIQQKQARKKEAERKKEKEENKLRQKKEEELLRRQQGGVFNGCMYYNWFDQIVYCYG